MSFLCSIDLEFLQKIVHTEMIACLDSPFHPTPDRGTDYDYLRRLRKVYAVISGMKELANNVEKLEEELKTDITNYSHIHSDQEELEKQEQEQIEKLCFAPPNQNL